MKVLLIVTALLVTVSALRIKERINGENGWYVPQVDGTNKWLDMQQVEQQQLLHSRASNEVSFYLYTKSNPSKGQHITATHSSISGSHFNKKHGTRFVIHGWNGQASDSMNTRITKAWLSRGDYNVIVVDWSGARTANYISAVNAVPEAGRLVGDMIKYLNVQQGVSLGSVYVIGHSLGSHVAGYSGKTVGSGKVQAIIGLDPAMPLFNYDNCAKRLCPSDAYYVESIQTNGGVKGFIKPIGKGTFYPNGGKNQPGCGSDLDGTCAHARSVIYYAEAVTKNNFGCMKCANYEKAVAKDCGHTYSSVRMGADSNAYMVGGDFYVPVNSEAPFGKTA
ncbi:phospholipase A1 VesT1.02-like [Drosophila busckii]|uniref:phospholipase A1 VesT1.02-like n=1 Tax=Drosophila busckii TaxID=30019 RepID=UPI00083F1CC0|nr:phospholipase A1 VesT1.02-like [Drosophila busckii]